ncbi:bacterio-opsin activator domain-containing protein [Halobacterium zhouii]|uniref:helix-turn-helix domain-containing protein n=1 Tax=Halobacterium zhouii TaxID=2902624 RepID=UPI001E2CFE74|nr:bacterio-opsin activator domain-containing protein [Halobacterium zhouii]
MSVVGNFTIVAESFALDHALSTAPDVTVEADRLASHSPQEVFPFLWAADGDLEGFQRALEDDPTTTSVSVAEETENELLYRLEWSEEFQDLIQQMVDHHAAILEAKARSGRWHLRLRFADEQMVSTFRSHFREAGREFEVNQLYHPTDPRQRTFGLTAEQHEALVTAVDEGYFAIPRETSTAELSEALDVSANAVSERIRRGCETLVRSGLVRAEDTK